MNREYHKSLYNIVIDFIVAEQRGSLLNTFYPDDTERNKQSVDCMFNISSQWYVMEHTRIESYARQIEDGEHFKRIFAPFESELPQLLPLGRYHLIVKARSVRGAKKTEDIRKYVGEWILKQASLLTSKHPGNEITDTLDGVPFEVTLRRETTKKTRFFISRYAPPKLEAERATRLLNALQQKCSKLSHAKGADKRSILLLESDDISLANVCVIGEALVKALKFLNSNIPDDIYLIETEYGARDLWRLKRGHLVYPDMDNYCSTS